MPLLSWIAKTDYLEVLLKLSNGQDMVCSGYRFAEGIQ